MPPRIVRESLNPASVGRITGYAAVGQALDLDQPQLEAAGMKQTCQAKIRHAEAAEIETWSSGSGPQ